MQPSALLADLAFGALDETGDIAAVRPPQQHDEDDRQLAHLPLAEQEEGGDGRKARKERGQRGIAGQKGARQPHEGEDERDERLEPERATEEGGDALAAAKAQPDRIEMAEEGAE